MHENSFKSTVLAALALALAPALSQAYEAGVESDNAPVAATTPALIPMTAQVTAKLPTLDNRLQKTDRLLKNLSDNSDPLREADVWGRIRSGYAIPDINNQLVANHVNWYATRPDHLARTTARASRYIFHVVQELEKRGMPTELALLPFIESAFNPQAFSRAWAAADSAQRRAIWVKLLQRAGADVPESLAR